MADTRHDLGLRGELAAEHEAVRRGWSPWRRRWRLAHTEIDLCLRRDTADGLALLLVEVKTTARRAWPVAPLESARKARPVAPLESAHDDGELLARWTPRQQARLWRAAAQLAETEGAASVSLALVVVVLERDRERLVWLDAEPF